MIQSAIEVCGDWPTLANQSIQSLVLQEFWYQGTLEDEAMVCWIRVKHRWYRIYFDMGVAYCQLSYEAPHADLSPDDLCDCRFNDLSHLLGLQNARVRQVSIDDAPSGMCFTLEFDSGVRFQLKHTRLRTEYTLQVTH